MLLFCLAVSTDVKTLTICYLKPTVHVLISIKEMYSLNIDTSKLFYCNMNSSIMSVSPSFRKDQLAESQNRFLYFSDTFQLT